MVGKLMEIDNQERLKQIEQDKKAEEKAKTKAIEILLTILTPLMYEKLILTILFATLFACHTTINIPTTNTTTMEKFDIETFNKNKTGNEWDIAGN